MAASLKDERIGLTGKSVIAKREERKQKSKPEEERKEIKDDIEIIEYFSSMNLNVRFLEDGVIVKNRSYRQFLEGRIRHPNKPSNTLARNQKKRVDEEGKSNSGLKMTIYKYRTAQSIDIIFDDGTIIENRTYANFLNGSIKYKDKSTLNSKVNENEKIKTITEKEITKKNRIERQGKKAVNKSGQEAEIIEYRNSEDIDVKFADGTVVKHVTYSRFNNGGVRNPNVIRKSPRRIEEREGEVSKDGSMTIEKYYNANNIDIKFTDGTLAKGRTYHNFKHGTIRKPKK